MPTDLHIQVAPSQGTSRSANKAKPKAAATYRLRVALLAILIVAYPVLAFVGPHQGKAEFYPFFSWNLFAKSASQKTDMVIFVTSIHGEPLAEPTLFYELQDEFAAAKARNSRLAKLLDNYYKAAARGDTATRDRLVGVIEETYLADVPELEYEIAVIGYDVLERYERGTLAFKRVLSRHQKERR